MKIESDTTSTIKKFNLTKRRVVFTIENTMDETIIIRAIKLALSRVTSADCVRVTIQCADNETFISFRPAESLDVREICESIKAIDNFQYPNSCELILAITTIKKPL